MHCLPDPPYKSQWGEMAGNVAVIVEGTDPAKVHNWRADGYIDGYAYRLWSRNTCGITCLQMILMADPDRWPWLPCKAALVAQAISWGVLKPFDDGSIGGLYYAPFVEWVAHDFGLEAQSRPDLPLDELIELVDSGEWYVMASVSYEIREPEQGATKRGGHLILVFRTQRVEPACDEGGEGEVRLVYHNPSGLPGSAEAASCTKEQFAEFYAGRGIAVRRSRG